ncbi:hypothetical protein MMC07_001463 [Pseudocyphellaria aurata]|nr:hypothetical protein [Pseudocyphellaria aurata]
MEQSSSSEFKFSASENAEFYSQLGMQYEKFYGHDAAHREIISRFLDLLPASNARVLDCGCGTGKPASHMIAARGYRLCGIDVSQTMIDLCRKQVPTGSFACVNMLEYEAPANNFDGIVVSLSLFELGREQLTSMVSKWFRWLQPIGILLLVVNGAEGHETTPEMYDSDGECARGILSRFMNRTAATTLFTKQGWNNLVTKAGFEIVCTEEVPFVPSAEAGSTSELRYHVIARKPVTGGN